MVWNKEQQRAARLAARPAFPRPRGPAPFGCTWNTSCGGWFMDGKEVTIVRNRKRSARATMKRPDHQRSLLGTHEHRLVRACATHACAHESEAHEHSRRAPN